MARIGETLIYDPKIRGNTPAKLFLKLFGDVDSSSAPLHFSRVAKKFVEKRDAISILDAGCGKGKYSFWLAQEYPNAEIDACDLSREKIEIIQDIQNRLIIRNINFFIQDLRTFKNEAAYDFIFSNHVLEHIVENQLVISNLVASLKPGGYIYIQIPDAVQKRFPFGKKFLKAYEKWEKDEHIGQTITLASLTTTLESLDCEIIKAGHTEGFFGELRFELAEIASSYFNSSILYGLLFPLLKTLGYIDSLINYSDGNGILVLAKKKKEC